MLAGVPGKRSFRKRGAGEVFIGQATPACYWVRPVAQLVMVKKLLHTRYRVNDLEKTVKFYTEVLGLEEVRRLSVGVTVLRSGRVVETLERDDITAERLLKLMAPEAAIHVG